MKARYRGKRVSERKSERVRVRERNKNVCFQTERTSRILGAVSLSETSHRELRFFEA